MIEENKIALFDAYRNEELSHSERQLLEHRMENEPLLKLEYEEYLEIVSGIRLFERTRLKQFLTESDTTKTTEAPLKVVHNQRFNQIFWIQIAVAAAVALLFVFPTINYFTFSDRILDKHQLDLISDNTMGNADKATRTDFYDGLIAKEKGKIEVAIKLLQRISDKDTNAYFIAQYEIALMEIERKDLATAKIILQNLTQRPENHFVKTKAENLLKDLEKSKFF